jgi:hypothetical protein
MILEGTFSALQISSAGLGIRAALSRNPESFGGAPSFDRLNSEQSYFCQGLRLAFKEFLNIRERFLYRLLFLGCFF